MVPPSPLLNANRLGALYATGVLDAPVDAALDRVARLAARVLGAPTALVSLVDAERQVFGGCTGLAEPWATARETPLSHSFCQHVVTRAEPLVIPDARMDPLVRHNLAIPDLGVIAYAGVPLVTADGHVLGSLCVIDAQPHAWTAADVATLEDLAQGVVADLALRVATRSLAAREADLADLLDHTEELTCCTDATGRFTLVNAAWQRTLGYTADEAAALTPLDLIAPEDAGRYRAVARQLMIGSAVREFEAVLVARDGRRVACRGWAVPQMHAAARDAEDARAVYGGARVGFRDVTAERQAEAARARLAAALDASPDFAALVVPGGGVVYLNRAGHRLVGLPEDADLALVTMAELHTPASQVRLLREALPAVQRDGTWSGESVLVGAGGEPVPVAVTLVSHSGADGAGPPLVTSIVARDLRERVRAESALRESETRARSAEARFRAALDASPDAGYLFEVARDPDGTVTDFAFAEVNAAAGALYGMPPEDLVGHTLSALFPITREESSTFQIRRTVADSGTSYEGEYRTRDPRATVGWLWLQVVPIRMGGAGSPVTGLAVTARDVTARKRAESEMRVLHEVTGALAAAGSADDALAAALHALCRATALPYGEVWVPDETRTLVRGPAWYEETDARLADFALASCVFTFATGEGLPGRAAASGAPVWLADVTAPGASFARAALAKRAGLRDGIAVPVTADGQVIAVLDFHSRHADVFAPEARALLAAVGAQIGTAVRRRQIEAVLREREAELRLTQDAGGMRGWTLDLAADELRLAPGMHDLVALGALAPAGAVIPGAIARAAIHPDDRAQAEADLAAACAHPDGHYTSTYRAPAPDGTINWVRATGRVERDAAGTPQHVRGVSVDVTEERALRDRAERSEAELRALFTAMRDVVLVLDEGGTYVEIVATAPDLLYQPAATMLGRRMHDVLPAASADPLLAVIRRVLATSTPEAVEYALDRPNAGRMWYSAMVSPLEARQVLWVARDISAQKRAEAALRELTTLDELTGLLNRRGFRPLAEQSLKVARRSGQPHALLYIDLDGFKPINDVHGHAAGDAALQAIARVLRDTVREGDLVARLGGDEFAVYAGRLAHTGEGHVVATRLQTALAAHNADAVAGGRQWQIGMSIGVAEAEPGDDLDVLLARADAALYVAKLGRRTVPR
ncbi:MAG TPA: PAS domain S-box protein [Gemmatirosa sp.]